MKVINFGIREMGELYALQFLVKIFADKDVQWNIFIVPFNSDLKLFDTRNIFLENENVKIFQGLENSPEHIIGFESSISNRVYDKIKPVINLCTVIVCMDNDSGSIMKHSDNYDIIVSNVKINDKDPSKEYDPNMWDLLGKLPYKIAVIPRHPFPEGYLNNIEIPTNIKIINKMGILKSLCASAKLVVMGLIFSPPKDELDHNPLEATINSNAICGIYDNEEGVYEDLYQNSGLLHKYKCFADSLSHIDALMNDSALSEKLEYRSLYIRRSKEKYIPEITLKLFSNHP